MKIGIIVAVEMSAIRNRFEQPLETIEIHSQRVEHYKIGQHDIYLIKSGSGEIAAASSTQLLISDCHVEAIFNFGIVGGLTDEAAKHRLCVVDSVVHYDYDADEIDHLGVGRYEEFPSTHIKTTQRLKEIAKQIEPELIEVVCASGDKFIANPERKKELHTLFNADICEMESAGILFTCIKNQIPNLFIKVVSDGLFGGEEEYIREYEATSQKAFDTLVKTIESLDTHNMKGE